MFSSGVPALDRLLGGGYPAKSAVLVVGGISSLKERLCYMFVDAGLVQDETCIYVTRLSAREASQEGIAQGLSSGRSPHWVASEGGEANSDFNNLASLSFSIKNLLKKYEGPRIRIVIDFLSPMLVLNQPETIYRFMSQLITDVKQYEAVLLGTLEQDMHRPEVVATMEDLFDGVVVLTTSDSEGVASPVLSIKKMRGIRLSERAVVTLANLEGVKGPEPAERVMDSRRIAVLPFANYSPDPNDEYFADGLTEELISTMSNLSGLKVIARTSVMAYKGDQKKRVDEIARELKVGTVLEGSVRKAGNKIRVTAQLINTASSEHLWAESYDMEMKDVFAIQSEISQTVADALKIRLLAGEKKRLRKEPTKNAEAYTLCLRGIYHSVNASSENDLRKALMYFERAIELDPAFALAYSWLSDCYTTLVQAGYLQTEEGIPKAEDAVRKALDLDSGLADAHRALSFILIMRKKPDWQGAEREIRKALELNPNVAAGHESFAWLLAYMGRLDEGLMEAREACELDPLSSLANQTVALVLYYKGDYDGAITQLLKARELDPGNRGIAIKLGMNYLQKSQYDDAIGVLKNVLQPSKGKADLSRSYLAVALARAGRTVEARMILDDFREASSDKLYIPALAIAQIFGALGEGDMAIRTLEKAYAEGEFSSLHDLKVSPLWDSIRSDPRFMTLLNKMGLITP